MKVKQDILNILEQCTVAGSILYLPNVHLDRDKYLNVNKCINNIGGKWNRYKKGHVFDYDPSELLDNILTTGEVTDIKKDLQFFPTPNHIANKLCEIAELDTDSVVLEPSCGKLHLADVIWSKNPCTLDCIEINKDFSIGVGERDYNITYGMDFLDFNTRDRYDRIIMNPPFSKQQDIDHIYHAYDLLSSDGILVSVLSCSPFFRDNKKSVEFREWISKLGAKTFDLPEGSFKESGTLVPAKILKVTNK